MDNPRLDAIRNSIAEFYNHDCGGYALADQVTQKIERDLELALFDEMVRLLKEAQYQLEVCRPNDAANLAHEIKKLMNTS